MNLNISLLSKEKRKQGNWVAQCREKYFRIQVKNVLSFHSRGGFTKYSINSIKSVALREFQSCQDNVFKIIKYDLSSLWVQMEVEVWGKMLPSP